MNQWMTAGILAAAIAFPTFAAAQDQSAPPAVGSIARDGPIKDCTRYNGFYGFYGNPWCSAEEQARWDRWEADRVRKGKSADVSRL